MNLSKPPDLEERFLPPENWNSGEFLNPKTKHKIHYNYALTKNNVGIVIALPGLSEFGEKYIETAHFFNEQGFDFYVIDWAYQGRSSRFSKNRHKRHSDGYHTDISDLDYMINNIIKDKKNLYMLAHSMGGNIGLRYLFLHQNIIKAASFSAPLLGIKDILPYQNLLKYLIPCIPCIKEKYIPKGTDWNETMRPNNDTDIFSSDPIRRQIHAAWSKVNPSLQIGNVTYKWLLESLKSISKLFHLIKTKHLNIPIIFCMAEKESLVSNYAIKKFSSKISSAKMIEIKNSKHEILMETDDVRNKFLKETLNIFNQSN